LTPFDLIKLAAASWYLAYALTHTHGPLGIFERLREWRGGRWHGRKYKKAQSVTGRDYDYGTEMEYHGLLDCIICLAPWIAAALYLTNVAVVIDVLAVAGVALWMHGFTSWRMTIK
jgi:hypothetical protein